MADAKITLLIIPSQPPASSAWTLVIYFSMCSSQCQADLIKAKHRAPHLIHPDPLESMGPGGDPGDRFLNHEARTAWKAWMEDFALKMCIVCRRAKHVFSRLVESGGKGDLKDAQ